MDNSRYELLYKLNQQLHELATKHMRDDLDTADNKSFFAAFTLGKAFKTHEAILLLCKNGFGEDAFMLSRTLFELMVMTLYILADETEDRLMRYVEHDWVTRKQMFDYIATKDELLKTLNEKIDSDATEPEVLATIEAEYQRVMDKYHYDIKGWSDKSIKGMAEDVGRGDAYKTVYKLQSIMDHTSSRSMNEYMQHDQAGTIINVGPNPDLVETALVIAFDFFGMTFEKVSAQLKWETDTELDNLGQKFSNILKK